jgi:hypothetical protein
MSFRSKTPTAYADLLAHATGTRYRFEPGSILDLYDVSHAASALVDPWCFHVKLGESELSGQFIEPVLFVLGLQVVRLDGVFFYRLDSDEIFDQFAPPPPPPGPLSMLTCNRIEGTGLLYLHHPLLPSAEWRPLASFWTSDESGSYPLFAFVIPKRFTSCFSEEIAYLLSLVQESFARAPQLMSCKPLLVTVHGTRAYLLQMEVSRRDLLARYEVVLEQDKMRKICVPNGNIVGRVMKRWEFRKVEEKESFVRDMASIICRLKTVK